MWRLMYLGEDAHQNLAKSGACCTWEKELIAVVWEDVEAEAVDSREGEAIQTYAGTVHCQKQCRNSPNSDVDNGGAEPKNVGVGIFRPPRRLVSATVVHFAT
jgi:hypothetical protein